MNIVLPYNPTPKQVLFHSSPADVLLYGGAAGGGKSRACVEDALHNGLKFAGLHIYLFRKTYPELNDTLIKEAKLCIPEDLGKYKENKHDFELINGSTLHFRYCRNMMDAYRYQGTEMHILYIDELTHFSFDIFEYLKTRVRIPTALIIKYPDLHPQTKCTSNPGGVGHGWVKDTFIDGKKSYKIYVERFFSETLQEEVEMTVQYIPAYALDNPHLTKQYIIELERKPKRLRDALLKGLWTTFEGQAFEEFVDDPEMYESELWTHVIGGGQINDDWTRYMSFDYGYSRPFSCHWHAVDYDGRVHTYRELYGTEGTPNVGIKWTIDQIAEKVLELEETEKNKNIIRIADPAIFAQGRERNGESIADTFAMKGIYFEAGVNSRLAGKAQVHYRLAFDEKGKPMWYIYRNCKHLIRTLPTLVQDQKNIEDIDTEGEDHAYDECRYLMMSMPIKPRKHHRKKDIIGDDPLNQKVVLNQPLSSFWTRK